MILEKRKIQCNIKKKKLFFGALKANKFIEYIRVVIIFKNLVIGAGVNSVCLAKK